MSERITLYHGGPSEYLGRVIGGKIPLIGKRVLDDSTLSGTLTDEEQFARNWAARKRGVNPVLLRYSLPKSLVIDEGLIAFKETAHGFVTNLEIRYQDIPKTYLQALFGFNLLNDSVVTTLIEMGKLSFHQVPHKYLQSYEYI